MFQSSQWDPKFAGIKPLLTSWMGGKNINYIKQDLLIKASC